MVEQPTRPRIGDFRSKPDNAPRKTPSVEAPQAVQQEEPDDKPADAPEAAKNEADMTPRERYLKRLKDAEIPLATAQNIYDAVISKGYYEEYVKVGSGRAVLRTRTYDDVLRLQTALEAVRPGLILTQEDMITRYNLAASLYEWKGKTYKHDTDDDFDVVMAELKKMPSPLYSLLVQRLAEFDRKVMTVFSEGATDSF